MVNLIKRLWADENGFVISAELVLISTIVGLGMVAGLAELSYSVNSEIHDVAQGFSAYNQQDKDRDWDDKRFGSSGPAHEQTGGGDLYGNR